MYIKKFVSVAQKHLMTATGYMIPFVVAGGIIMAVSVMLSGQPAQPTDGWLAKMYMIGNAGMTLFIPALGGYIAYSISDRPGLAPGFITAFLATELKTGFIGGIIGGVLAGIVVQQLERIKIAPNYKTLGSIFLYPLAGTLVSGGIMVFLIGDPIASFMNWLTTTLSSMGGMAKAPLGAILGSMIGFDMGGPMNKVAATFAQTQINTLPYLMGGVGAAACVPPIGLGIATLIFKKKFSATENDSGKAALLMGFCGITEGAIPFATADPIRVIIANTVGAAVACVTAFMLGCLSHAPWGGLIVLPVVENKLGYILAIAVGSMITASIVGFTKKIYVEETEIKTQKNEELEFSVEQF